jgi:hypothetical protein
MSATRESSWPWVGLVVMLANPPLRMKSGRVGTWKRGLGPRFPSTYLGTDDTFTDSLEEIAQM